MVEREKSPLRFAKLSVNGNDFVILSEEQVRNFDLPKFAKKVLKRRFSIGGDGLLVIKNSGERCFHVRYFNPDGSEAEICGNSLISIGTYIRETHRLEGGINVVFPAGQRKVRITEDFIEAEIGPVKGSVRKVHLSDVKKGLIGYFTDAIGNPHFVIKYRIPEDEEFFRIAPLIEKHPEFPNRTNVNFLEIHDRHSALLRVWERGVGETLSCATGAAASFLVSLNQGWLESPVTITMRGGKMELFVENGMVWYRNQGIYAFRGELLTLT